MIHHDKVITDEGIVCQSNKKSIVLVMALTSMLNNVGGQPVVVIALLIR